MNDLLLCALKRRGSPATASELYDEAIGLASVAGWPRRTWTATSIKQAAALLKGLVARGVVDRVGFKRENGRDVPAFAPAQPQNVTTSRWDATAPIPDAPQIAADSHPLSGLNNRQRFVLFDLMESTLLNYARQHGELLDMLHRHSRELADAASRTKRELLAVQFSDEGGSA